MAKSIQLFGLCTVRTGSGAANALEDFGYTVNGANITFDAYWLDVKGDENGGDPGPPIDIQYMGETARVRLEMNKWDEAVEDKIQRLKAAVLGQPGTAGTLVFAGSKFFRLLLDNANHARVFNFPLAVLRDAKEINAGTRHQVLRCDFVCYKNPDTGILWDRTYS